MLRFRAVANAFATNDDACVATLTDNSAGTDTTELIRFSTCVVSEAELLRVDTDVASESTVEKI